MGLAHTTVTGEDGQLAQQVAIPQNVTQAFESKLAANRADKSKTPNSGTLRKEFSHITHLDVGPLRYDGAFQAIFTEAGEAANVVPERAAATWYVRSPTVRGLEKLKARVLACLEAGATAAGCAMEHAWIDPAFANMVDNDPMIERYRANLARTGRTLTEPS